MKLTGEQVYEILQEFRKGDFVSLHDSNVQGRYLITSTYGIYTITEKLNKLLENEKGLKPEYIILTRMETIVDMIKIIAESITKTEDKINKEFLWIKLGLNKIQEQLTSLSGENKKESPQKEETQEKSCATCGHFDIICKKDWCGDSYKGWQPKDNQESR